MALYKFRIIIIIIIISYR